MCKEYLQVIDDETKRIMNIGCSLQDWSLDFNVPMGAIMINMGKELVASRKAILDAVSLEIARQLKQADKISLNLAKAAEPHGLNS